MKRIITLAMVATMCLGLACSKFSKEEQSNGNPGETGAENAKYAFSVFGVDTSGGAGTKVYGDDTSAGAFTMVEGKEYIFDITALDSGGPYVYVVSIEQVDLFVGGVKDVIEMAAGPNRYTAKAAGDYTITIAAKKGESLSPARSFQAAVECDSPVELNDKAINPGKMTVTGADNLYSYNSAGVVGAVGGRAPHYCAWDLNGDGSRDTRFGLCGTTLADQYANYIEDRNVGIIVRDSCNKRASGSALKNLPAPGLLALDIPSDQMFINGNVTKATGGALNHKGIWDNGQGAKYWATNNKAAGPVRSLVKADTTNSSFTIASDKFTYGAPSSVTFGMKIEMGKLDITLGKTKAETKADADDAILAAIDYSTDRVADAQGTLKLSGNSTHCTLIRKGIEVIDVIGTPCAPGTTNPEWDDKEMRWTFKVWGEYSCTGLTGPSSTINISGIYNGSDDLIDACVGGGQGGQGGDFPPDV